MLDVSKWKFFRLGDYFEVKKGKRLTKEDQTEGLTPYLGAIDSNNGVASFIGQEPIHNGNTISLSYNGSVGEAFYQPVDYWSTDDVNALYPKDIPLFNARIGLFVCTILRQEKYRYSYGRKWVLEEMENALIKLPAISKETPDWKFMERCIKCLENRKDGSGQTIVKSLQTKNASRCERVETNGWREFQVGKLFRLEQCLCSNAGELLEEGTDIEYIGAKKTDNGFMQMVKANLALTTKGNCIVFICDGQGSVGYANYMPHDFIGSTTLTVGYNPRLNNRTGVFLVSVLDLERHRYSYGRKYRTNLSTTKIRLPATPLGDPDWAYMEKYIRSLPYGDRI